MIRQILPNNNERCYSNFSPTFREVNTPSGNIWYCCTQHHHWIFSLIFCSEFLFSFLACLSFHSGQATSTDYWIFLHRVYYFISVLVCHFIVTSSAQSLRPDYQRPNFGFKLTNRGRVCLVFLHDWMYQGCNVFSFRRIFLHIII
jgi:hypothetical protein